jgi:uracil-DNA glycosylase
MTDINIGKAEGTWKKILKEYQDEHEQEYRTLIRYIKYEYHVNSCYPAPAHIFKWSKLTPFEEVKVVILGQDPYYNVGQATGLAFGVNMTTNVPASLKNIFEEVTYDLGRKPSTDCTLEHWAKQGVLLLNSVLTVRHGEPNSHKESGWMKITDYLIKRLSDEKEGLVFLLWGNNALKKLEQIDKKKHIVLTSSHPSPLSVYRGFCGCKHFSKVNTYLTSIGQEPIDW